jgi:hypothetical protein
MSNSKLFTRNFSPYKKKYIYKTEDGWFSESGFLSDDKIERALEGVFLYGYYLSTCPRAFAVDIDDHTGKGDGYILSVYNSVQERFRAAPSAVCRTPRGLHAHYFLQYPIPEILLIDRAAGALKGLPVEVRPTHTTGLRIPQISNFIDPQNFLPLNETFDDIVTTAPHYHPAELFTESILPGEVRSTLHDRKVTAYRLRELEKVARIENGFDFIYPHTTNEALCSLIPVYRTLGLSPDEAAARFTVLLAPVYDGELKNYHRLLQRVKSFYRHQPESQFTAISANIQNDLFSEIAAAAVRDQLSGNPQNYRQKAGLTKSRNTLYKSVLAIENWKAYIDFIKKNRQRCEMWNYLYPFFKKNTSEGFYPIPSSFLLKLHTNYERWLLPFLEDIGYLERSPYGYSAGYGTCYHYRINTEKFI